jgi:hypothetical protein
VKEKQMTTMYQKFKTRPVMQKAFIIALIVAGITSLVGAIVG